ncbi:hypothetical protein Cgig2_013466 [Carnegiea gigantea]|uniref:Protein phosphatase methylesterase 1 n=1 Tax=Carnegiea gigantea TaxID=171969 RepID=A0A9Q1QD68_9CARY|nr:hypothetical protein Cgig2_013466 [Carnegiea gigantea]
MNTCNLPSLAEEESSDDRKPPSPASPQLPPPPQHQHLSSDSAFSNVPDRPASQSSSGKYSPLDWTGYFDEEDDIRIPDTENVFHVYKAGAKGPVVFCLHGGGYSGLSFALSAGKIKEKARVVAMDLRGHGKSTTDNDRDLSIETLCSDVLAVLNTMYGEFPPAIVLIGHSMGGSVAVHVAAKKTLPSLAGLVVVDVVEGTALASLIHMQKILSSRMQHFATIDKAVNGCKSISMESVNGVYENTCALLYTDVSFCIKHLVQMFLMVILIQEDIDSETRIRSLSFCAAEYKLAEGASCVCLIEWSVKGGSLRNIDSARVSIPATLTYDDSKKWYEGLSDKFLASPVPKLLLLAGTDRLDRTLTIGQMQGKFQMVVVRHTGHAIQEDVPDEFATLVLNFISRNRIGPHGIEIPGLPKPSK